MSDKILETDKICVEISDNHTYQCNAATLSRAGENEVTKLELVVPEELSSYWAYLDFKTPTGEKYKTTRLEIVDNKIEYEIPLYLISQKGYVEVQLVLQNDSGKIWKSTVKKYTVLTSINAVDDIPESEKDDFITEAQRLLDTLEPYIDELKNKALPTNIASAIKNTKSGEIIVADDVSPVEHSLGVVIKSKNLFNLATVTVGKRVKNTDGTLSTPGAGDLYCVTDFIPVTPNATYICSGFSSHDDLTRQFAYYDKDKKFVSGSSNSDFNNVIPKNAFYMRRNFFTEDIDKIQIEVGSTATEYAPYVDASTVKVSRYGKNLQPYPYYSKSGSSNGINFTVNPDGSININGTATANTDFNFVNGQAGYRQFIKAGTYTISGNPTDMGMNMFLYEERNSTSNYAVYGTKNGVPTTFTITKDSYYFWYIRVPNGKSVNNMTLYPQIEVGTTATEYELYKEPQTVTVNANGTVEGLKSVSPNMTLLTDTQNVTIYTDYNVDTKTYIDRKFAELSQALLNL